MADAGCETALMEVTSHGLDQDRVAGLEYDLGILTHEEDDDNLPPRDADGDYDEFYDRAVKLVVAAERPITELYRGTRLTFEFERTQSRLIEMQSQEYLAREHRP